VRTVAGYLFLVAIWGCTPRSPSLAPVPACTASLPDASPWPEDTIPGFPITLRFPPHTEPAPAAMRFAPAQAMWQIRRPDSTYSFVALWIGPRTPTDRDTVVARTDVERCDIVLGGRPSELVSALQFGSLGISYTASAQWPISPDSSVHLWAQAPSASGIRTGLAVIRSLWPRPPRP
jgi:hypothetical protein